MSVHGGEQTNTRQRFQTKTDSTNAVMPGQRQFFSLSFCLPKNTTTINKKRTYQLAKTKFDGLFYSHIHRSWRVFDDLAISRTAKRRPKAALDTFYVRAIKIKAFAVALRLWNWSVSRGIVKRLVVQINEGSLLSRWGILASFVLVFTVILEIRFCKIARLFN